MAKTKFDEMMDRLPSTIKDSDVLRLQSKKVLAALLDLLLHSKARESKVIFCQNSRLRKLSGINSNDLLTSIQQLIDYDLITRKVGTKKDVASEYTINFKKLKEPIVEKTFDDLFQEFLEDDKSQEKPINTPITTTIPITISTTTSTTISTSTATTTSTTSSTATPTARKKFGENMVLKDFEENRVYSDEEFIEYIQKASLTEQIPSRFVL